MPFGDQGLMLRATTLARLGGFDESLALGEDLALVLRRSRPTSRSARSAPRSAPARAAIASAVGAQHLAQPAPHLAAEPRLVPARAERVGVNVALAIFVKTVAIRR
jgi:hypothetical protein